MSAKIMGAVWDSNLPQEEKYVALAYADHADHEGENIFPSNDLVAWKTGYSVRQVQRLRAKLIQRGVLVASRKNKGGRLTNKYSMDIDALPKRPDFKKIRGVNLTPPDVNLTPPIEDLSHDIDVIPGVTQQCHGRDDKVMSYDPSFNHQLTVTLAQEKTKNLQELLDDPGGEYWQDESLPEEVQPTGIVENNNGHDPSADCEKNHSLSESPEEARRRSIREALERGVKKNGGASLEDKLIDLYLVSVPDHLRDLARSFCTCVCRPPNRKEDSYWRSEWQTQYELGLTAGDIHDGYWKMMNDGLSIKSPASVTCIAENIRRKSKFDMQKTERSQIDKEMEKRAARLRGSQSIAVGGRVFNKDEVMQMDDTQWNTALSQAIQDDMLDHMTPLEI